MAGGIRHPITAALYEPDAENATIRVTTRDGRVGVYRGDGRWVSGDKFDIDPQLCVWLHGPRRGSRLAAPTEGS
jgi:hypothetical protein